LAPDRGRKSGAELSIAARIIAATLFLATPLAPLAAQDGFDNEADLPAFTLENIQPALKAAGATKVEVQTTDSGSDRVRAEFDTRILLVTPTACSDEGDCLGLSFRAYWRVDVGLDQDLLAQKIDEFNGRAVANMQYADGTAMLSFYIIGDYGMPQGNVRVATRVFLDNLDKAMAATS